MVLSRLVINTMKAESVQFNQLILQNLANVWRKAVFQNVLKYQLKQLDEREAKKLEEKQQKSNSQLVWIYGFRILKFTNTDISISKKGG